jgi:hypothetical protein
LTLGLTSAKAPYLFAPLLVSAALVALVIYFDVWPRLYRPIDAGRCFRGKRLFGDHKTWRGVVVEASAAGLALACEDGHVAAQSERLTGRTEHHASNRETAQGDGSRGGCTQTGCASRAPPEQP